MCIAQLIAMIIKENGAIISTFSVRFSISTCLFVC